MTPGPCPPPPTPYSMCAIMCEGQGFLATASKDGSVRIWSLQGICLGVAPPLDFATGAALSVAQAVPGADQQQGGCSVLWVAYESGHMVLWTLPALEVRARVGG